MSYSDQLTLNPIEAPPPHSPDSESALIGDILTGAESIPAILAELKPTDFYYTSFQVIHMTANEIAAKNLPVELSTIADTLRSTGILEEIRFSQEVGYGALQCISDHFITIGTAEGHIRIVKNHATKRKLKHIGLEMAANAYEMETPDIISATMKSISEVDGLTTSNNKPLPEAVNHILSMRRDGQPPIVSLTTGFVKLDNLSKGLNRGGLIVLAGETNSGKSIFGMDIAVILANFGMKVLFESLEMTQPECVDRALRFTACQWEGGPSNYEAAGERLKTFPIKFLHSPGLSKSRLKLDIQKARQEMKGLDLVVVDYLQLMQFEKGENRTLQVGEMTCWMKQLAGEFDLPVLCLSQFNREASRDKKTPPHKGMLRDSGSIEQDADKIFLIWEPPESEGLKRKVIVDKNRHGAKGEVDFFLDGANARFTEL